MKLVGTTDHGEVVELNRKAVEQRSPHLRERESRPHGWRAQIGRRRPVRLQEPSRAPQPPGHARLLVVHGSGRERSGDERRAHGPPGGEVAERFSHRDDAEQSHVRPTARFLAQERGRLDGRRAFGEQRPRVHAFEASAVGAAGNLPACSVAVRRDGRLRGRMRVGARANARAVLRAVSGARAGPGRRPGRRHSLHKSRTT